VGGHLRERRETNATPIHDEITLMVETTLATSDRRGFPIAMVLAPLLRPFIAARVKRLWVDDLAYTERRFAVRSGEV